MPLVGAGVCGISPGGFPVHDADTQDQQWSAWMIAAQAGDQTAYESLLSELAPAIRSYLLASFGAYHHIDDCVQECLLAIHQGRHSYNAAFPFKPWFYAVVRNKTIDVLRRTPLEADEAPPELTAKLEDLVMAIDGNRLLSRLSANLREAVLLTKFVGLSTKECALHLNISESLVKVRVFRGIRKLRAVWDAEH